MSLNINIVNTSPHTLPAYATEGASGLDVRANLTEPTIIQPLERCLIPTGLFLEIPEGYEAQVRSRSGLALKQGIICLNSPGTIDADYRGEIKIILINLSNEVQTVQQGDRIAQLVFQKIEKISWSVVETINATARGGNGFGHTGKQ